MLRHADALWAALDRELVVSRRLGHYTARYSSIEQDLEQQLRSIGRYLVYAHLRFD